jgi:hypothetical protein
MDSLQSPISDEQVLGIQIPGILVNKLKLLNIRTGQDIIDLSVDDFAAQRSVGVRSINAFAKFKRQLEESLRKTGNEPRGETKEMTEGPAEASKLILMQPSPIIGERVCGIRIPSILIKKLKHLNVQTGQDIINLSVDDFAAQRSVGVRSIDAFAKFKRQLEESLRKTGNEPRGETKEMAEDPAEVSKLLLTLPTAGIMETDADSMWRAYHDAVHEFVQLYDGDGKNQFEDLIGWAFGMFGRPHIENDEIGQQIGRSGERARQLTKKVVAVVRQFSIGVSYDSPRCCLDPKIHLFLKNERSRFEDELILPYTDQAAYLVAVKKLWYHITMMQIGPPAMFSFTQGKFVFFNYQRHGVAFSHLGKAAIEFLNERAIAVSESEMVKHLKAVCKAIPADVFNELVPNVLEKFPEIEALNSEDEGMRYQLYFWKLSRGDRRAYRVLFERNEPMSIEDLMAEIKERMLACGLTSDFTKESLRLTGTDNQFKSRGKMGIWGLAEWPHWDDLQTGGLDDVIRSVMGDECRGYEMAEIIKRCHAVRSDLKAYSIQARCYVVCIQLTDDRFILPEWSEMPEFKDRVIGDRSKYGEAMQKRTVKVLGYLESIIAFLEAQPDKRANSTVVVAYLKKTFPNASPAVFYKLFNESPSLRKVVVGHRKNIIELVDQGDSSVEEMPEGPQVQLRL